MRIVSFRLIVLLFILLAGVASQSQSHEVGLLRWSVTVADAEVLAPVPRTYRLFDSTREVTLRFAFFNEAGSAILISSDPFTQGVRVRVTATGTVPTQIEWASAIRRSGDSFTTEVAPGEQVRVEPRQGLVWQATLRPEHGNAFEPGPHEIHIELAESLRAVQTLATGDEAVRGLSETRLHLAIELPTTPEQQAAMYRVTAYKAMREGRPAEAVDAFAKALEAAPTDAGLLVGLGNASMLLNIR